MGILQIASSGKPNSLIKKLAASEGVKPLLLCELISRARAVVPLNSLRNIEHPCVIGMHTRTKVNANIGTSPDKVSVGIESKKMLAAIAYGADTIMDLSTGGDIAVLRRKLINICQVPFGTVPVYEATALSKKRKGDLLSFTAKDILDVIEAQARDGVDFVTIHSGVNRQSLAALGKSRRIMGIVSRGGAIIAAWMRRNKKENPFFEFYDKILDIARRYDVTLSLGDGLRPGSILDATDNGQIEELKILGQLAGRAYKKGVQAMIEGPGHVPISQIRQNIELQKRYCNGAPFYVLGPLVTDVAPGYDHITSAIGGALAAGYGADFLCYVTPSEHLRHPSIDDVREGVIAARIAAHAGDIMKTAGRAAQWDKKMSIARRKRDWQSQIKLSIDPVKAKQYRDSSKPGCNDACTMCGDYCSIRLNSEKT